MDSSKNVEPDEPVVVVSGLPRSGTSMAMQMLAAGGIPVVTDGIRKPGEDNPQGYFEDERVKALYKEDDDGAWLAEARGKAIKIISFLLKDLPVTNRYKVIFMRRELEEVLASQRKMLDRRGEDTEATDERMLELWKQHLDQVDELTTHAAHIERLDVRYADVIANPTGEAHRIRDFLRLDLDSEKMASAVSEKLYRNRS